MSIAETPDVFGLTWDRDGLLYSSGSEGIYRVSPNGGTPRRVVTLHDGEWAHGPQMLPGGDTIVFTLAKGIGVDDWDAADIVAQSLTSGQRKVLVRNSRDGRYIETGHLLYAQGGVVFAVPFDPRSAEVIGNPVPVVDGVRRVRTPVRSISACRLPEHSYICLARRERRAVPLIL